MMIVNSRSTDSNGVVGGGGRWLRGLGSLVRRKQVDSAHVRREGHELARKLSAVDLVGIGNQNSVFCDWFSFLLLSIFKEE